MPAKKIILDTSSIIFSLSRNHDVFELLLDRFPGSEIHLSNGIINEINGIAGSRTRYSKSAKAALALIKRNKHVVISSSREYPDNWIMNSASEETLVCTNDTALKKALKKRKVQVLGVSLSGMLR